MEVRAGVNAVAPGEGAPGVGRGSDCIMVVFIDY